MAKQIKVTIDKVGRPKIEAIGFIGGSCKTATEGLERMFTAGNAKEGSVVVEEKEELYMLESAPQQENLYN